MNKSLNNEDLHPNSTFYTFWYLTFLRCSSRCQACAPASWRFNPFNFATYWPCFIEQSTMKYPTHIYSSKNLRQSRFPRNSDESRFLEGIVTSWYQLQSRTFQNIKLLWSPHPPALSTEVPLVANGSFLPQKVFNVSFLNPFHLRILHWTTFHLKMEFFITTF